MYNIGSFRNPYPQSTFTNLYNTGKWYGGWVISGSELTYHSQNNIQYVGKGEKNNPIPQTIYSEMCSCGFWIGGWVKDLQDNRLYYDKNQVSYSSNIGTLFNPCPINLYEEMSYLEIWDGGYVEYYDGSIHLIKNYEATEDDGDGCGSGRSSGSGSGCGSSGCGSSGCGYSGIDEDILSTAVGRIVAGSGIIGTLYSGAAEVSVSWGSGITYGPGEKASITYSLRFKSNEYTLVSCNIHGQWYAPYEANILGSFTYRKDQVLHTAHIYGGHFTVPSSERV